MLKHYYVKRLNFTFIEVIISDVSDPSLLLLVCVRKTLWLPLLLDVFLVVLKFLFLVLSSTQNSLHAK